MAPGNEGCTGNVLRSFVVRTDEVIKAREVIMRKLYFSHPEAPHEKLNVAFNLFLRIVITCFQ